MDNLITKISEIETSASSVMEHMNERKAQFARDMQQRTADFDHQLEAETAEKLQALRSRMEAEMKNKLDRQEADGKKHLADLDHIYETTHARLAASLFQQMTKE